MKFALVNGDKTEAQPGLLGACAYCQSDMIAHCGSEKIWHWKHKRKSLCDPWWENETAWHRKWKDLFPKEWQENNHADSTTGEKHRADIKTDKGLIIEFQHSAIKSDEIKRREKFYKNMVWVVDGTRLTRGFSRFHKGFSDLRHLTNTVFLSYFPEECFPASWINSSVAVYFDFYCTEDSNQPDRIRESLWCLLPDRVDRRAVVIRLSREQFIEDPHLLQNQDIHSKIEQLIKLKDGLSNIKENIRQAAYRYHRKILRDGRCARF